MTLKIKNKRHQITFLSILTAVVLVSSAFTAIPSAYSQTIIFQDDYSTNSGWTQVSTLVTVDDPSFPDIVKFNGVPDASDRRVYKSLGTTLSDTWALESEFIATAFNIPSHVVFALTSGTGDPIITAPSMLGIAYSNVGSTGEGFQILTSNATNLDADFQGSKILVGQNQKVYLRLSRTSATTATFEVFSDAARTQHVTGSPVQITTIPANISGLDTLQHANGSNGGAARNLTAELDNTTIFDTGISTCNGLTPTIEGTAGNDSIVGTLGNDVIAGLGGNDIISGMGGNDTICGGDGDDMIFGNEGNDFVDGDAGKDLLSGNSGIDELRGSAGDDRIIGGSENDTLKGNNGSDMLVGEAGADTLNGGNDFDICDGGSETNTIAECEL